MTSLDGIERIPHLMNLRLFYTGVESIDIGALSRLKELAFLHVAGPGNINFTDWHGPSNLKNLKLQNKIIDFTGIGILSNLESLEADDCGTTNNIQELAKLKRLTYLKLNVTEPVKSLDFLGKMSSLANLSIFYEYRNSEISFWDTEQHEYKRIDLSVLKDLVNLQTLFIHGFTLDNFSFLDALPNLKYINIENSRFYSGGRNELHRNDIFIDNRTDNR
jgi:Leucine-rich repeat (LRR) protein